MKNLEFYNTCVRIAEEVNHTLFFKYFGNKQYSDSSFDYKRVGTELRNIYDDYEKIIVELSNLIKPYTDNAIMKTMIIHIMLYDYEPLAGVMRRIKN